MPPDLVVVERAVASLVPYAANARLHSEEQVRQLAGSIQEFGFVNPVLVDANDVLVAGHGRLLAAQRLGLATVPVIRLGHLSPAQARALRIADNQLALTSSWDKALLAAELAQVTGEGFSLALLGFDDNALAALAPRRDEDAPAPEPPRIPVTRAGDVWLLGPHRLRCGSSTSAEDVAALLAGARPHLMVTDPPYGVEYDAGWRNKAMRASGRAIGGRATGAVLNDDQADWTAAWALFPGDVAYVWHAGNKSHVVADSLLRCGFGLRGQIIWAKSNLVIGRGHYHPKHEPCWYAVRDRAQPRWQGGRRESSLWHIDKPVKSDTGHSTQKPVECMRRPIENSSREGDSVFEPFSGSGTTIIAGEATGRAVFAMELSPAYVDVAVRRWQAYTGQQATLEGDGGTLDAIAAARGIPAAA